MSTMIKERCIRIQKKFIAPDKFLKKDFIRIISKRFKLTETDILREARNDADLNYLITLRDVKEFTKRLKVILRNRKQQEKLQKNIDLNIDKIIEEIKGIPNSCIKYKPCEDGVGYIAILDYKGYYKKAFGITKKSACNRVKRFHVLENLTEFDYVSSKSTSLSQLIERRISGSEPKKLGVKQ